MLVHSRVAKGDSDKAGETDEAIPWISQHSSHGSRGSHCHTVNNRHHRHQRHKGNKRVHRIQIFSITHIQNDSFSNDLFSLFWALFQRFGHSIHSIFLVFLIRSLRILNILKMVRFVRFVRFVKFYGFYGLLIWSISLVLNGIKLHTLFGMTQLDSWKNHAISIDFGNKCVRLRAIACNCVQFSICRQFILTSNVYLVSVYGFYGFRTNECTTFLEVLRVLGLSFFHRSKVHNEIVRTIFQTQINEINYYSMAIAAIADRIVRIAYEIQMNFVRYISCCYSYSKDLQCMNRWK